MRIIALSVSLLCATVINAQTETKKAIQMSAGEDSYHAKLRLTTNIVDGRYCADGRIRYSLSFKFTNAGRQTIILDRFEPVVTRYMISRNEKAASAQHYEAVAHMLIGLDQQAVSLDSNSDDSRFIVLKVGESYEVQGKFSLSIKDEQGKLLRSGTHVLQVVVLTWQDPRASNIEWREKLRPKGYLWSDSIRSDPMPFVIVERPSVSECQ